MSVSTLSRQQQQNKLSSAQQDRLYFVSMGVKKAVLDNQPYSVVAKEVVSQMTLKSCREWAMSFLQLQSKSWLNVAYINGARRYFDDYLHLMRLWQENHVTEGHDSKINCVYLGSTVLFFSPFSSSTLHMYLISSIIFSQIGHFLVLSDSSWEAPTDSIFSSLILNRFLKIFSEGFFNISFIAWLIEFWTSINKATFDFLHIFSLMPAYSKTK